MIYFSIVPAFSIRLEVNIASHLAGFFNGRTDKTKKRRFAFMPTGMNDCVPTKFFHSVFPFRSYRMSGKYSRYPCALKVSCTRISGTACNR